MANRYVRTDGNDGNDGTADNAGHAWLTWDHGYASISDGDVLHMGPGTYVGHGGTFAGAMELNRAFGVETVIQSTNGDPSTTILGGSGASNYNFIQTAAISNLTFRNLSLHTPAIGTQPTPGSIVRFRAAPAAHIYFDACDFQANAGLAGASYFAYTDGDHVDHQFRRCTATFSGSNVIDAKIWTILGGTITGVQFLGCKFHSTAGVIVDWPVSIANGLIVLGGEYVNTNPVHANVGHALRVGNDEVFGAAVAGVRVEGGYFYAASTHAVLFGARTGGAISRLNLCVSDYDIALVSKENAGSLIENNVLVTNGTQVNSGALTMKGVWDTTVRGNWLIANSSGTGYALGCYQGDSPNFRPCVNVAAYGNRLTALGGNNDAYLLGAVGMQGWVSATDFVDSLPSWFDQHWLDLRGGATSLGQVNNVMGIGTLPALRGAWGGFNGSNDAQSALTGQEVTFAHASTTDLLYGIVTGADAPGPQMVPWGASAVRLGELPGASGTFRWSVPFQYAGAGTFTLRVYQCNANGFYPDPTDTLLGAVSFAIA